MISVIILHPNNTPKATKNDSIPGAAVDDVVRRRIIVMIFRGEQMKSNYWYYHWRPTVSNNFYISASCIATLLLFVTLVGWMVCPSHGLLTFRLSRTEDRLIMVLNNPYPGFLMSQPCREKTMRNDDDDQQQQSGITDKQVPTTLSETNMKIAATSMTSHLLALMAVALCISICAHAFQSPTASSWTSRRSSIRSSSIEEVDSAAATASDEVSSSPSKTTTLSREEQLAEQKLKILGLVQLKKTYIDPVLADPVTKSPLQITAQKKGREVKFQLKPLSTTNNVCYEGSPGTYLDLLNPVDDVTTSDNDRSSSATTSKSTEDQFAELMRQATPYLPPPLRSLLASTTADGEYVPMRDLFTSPAVSFAYERGWRQGFAQAGFPGPDVEAKMASEYFAPSLAASASKNGNKRSVLVDMSCATGLFTRRFASMNIADRVIGCDYSDSMLTEARRRIQSDPALSQSRSLDLVRLDVGQIPMQDNSVDALNAGAAMHCWPDLDAAASEIYRVLKPGGRYFASTFLSSYFSTLSGMDGQANTPPTQQAFQYFEVGLFPSGWNCCPSFSCAWYLIGFVSQPMFNILYLLPRVEERRYTFESSRKRWFQPRKDSY